ncbi:hypothetical protein BJ965_001631 [Streptomyces luteogriseus]|uniref:Uncharacterized protein n=1 Tax=Streptomyces luteogriseus TaxID=68233 RepID=A0A7W7DKL3_9ACTN|nr:hypothetical protein [Streptomyces luteogriseus]
MRILKSVAKALKEEGAGEPDPWDTAPVAPPVSPSAPAATDGRGR